MPTQDESAYCPGYTAGGGALPDKVSPEAMVATPVSVGVIRKFETGATRNVDETRDDPEGFMSPIVIDRFNQYMSKNRHQADGSVRDSDNWQKGIPLEAYIKGLWRHMLHAWSRHRGWKVTDPGAAATLEDDLCAILFNTQGYLHEILKDKYREAA